MCNLHRLGVLLAAPELHASAAAAVQAQTSKTRRFNACRRAYPSNQLPWAAGSEGQDYRKG